jgi:transposase
MPHRLSGRPIRGEKPASIRENRRTGIAVRFRFHLSQRSLWPQPGRLDEKVGPSMGISWLNYPITNNALKGAKERPTMKKNNKVAAGKKQKTVEKEVKNKTKQLRQDVRIMLLQLERAKAAEENKRKAAEQKSKPVAFYVGIDLGDKRSRYCFLNQLGVVTLEGSLATSKDEFLAYFSSIPRSRIALEVGTHSPWVNDLLEGLGHEVYVANPRKMESIHKNKRKNDRVDAKILARCARADVELLHPIQHRGVEVRQDLILLRARDAMVSVRTKLVNSMRGLVKSVGGRLPGCSTHSFHKTDVEKIPEGIRATLLPMLEQIGSLTKTIDEYDKRVSALARKKYPDTKLLQQVKGVGDLTALAYVLTLEKPERFAKSRDVGPYIGLVPRQDDSGESSPQLRITKTGDRMLRRLLVGSAHYIMGVFGEDCDLKRHGEKLAAGGKNAKKRAVVAIARKLAVLLHSLWRSGEVYEPLRHAKLEQKALPEAINS